MKNREYRIYLNLRQQNLREQRRLNEAISGRMGMQSVCRNNLAAVTREQHQLKEELLKIRATGPTTWGVLPPRDDGTSRIHKQEGGYLASGTKPANGVVCRSSRAQEKEQQTVARLDKKIAAFNQAMDKKNRTEDKYQSEANSPTQSNDSKVQRLPLNDPKMDVSTDKSRKGASGSTNTGRNPKQGGNASTEPRQQDPNAKPFEKSGLEPLQTEQGQALSFDTVKDNPDKILRTVDVLPDFSKTWSQAKKTRYVRHRHKPDHERELSLYEMFKK